MAEAPGSAKTEEARVGAPLVTYRYEVDLTNSRGLKLLDTREFKYGAGDVDKETCAASGQQSLKPDGVWVGSQLWIPDC
jgi:hypothetical protein